MKLTQNPNLITDPGLPGQQRLLCTPTWPTSRPPAPAGRRHPPPPGQLAFDGELLAGQLSLEMDLLELLGLDPEHLDDPLDA